MAAVNHRAEPELNDCPFCAGDTLGFHKEYGLGHVKWFWQVECKSCLARGPRNETRWEAAEEWNAVKRG